MDGVNINRKNLTLAIKKRHLSAETVSRELGKPKDYIENVLRGDPMDPTAVKLFCVLHNVPESALTSDERDVSAYTVTFSRSNGKIYASLFKDGEELGNGFAAVLSDITSVDVAVAQAFSYATHMMFKNVQCAAEYAEKDGR